MIHLTFLSTATTTNNNNNNVRYHSVYYSIIVVICNTAIQLIIELILHSDSSSFPKLWPPFVQIAVASMKIDFKITMALLSMRHISAFVQKSSFTRSFQHARAYSKSALNMKLQTALVGLPNVGF